MTRYKQLVHVFSAGIIAGLVANCGGSAMDVVGDAMMDAGGTLQDAGMILADAMVDGGGALLDTGDGIRDAGDAMTRDAQAQASCGMCTAGGASRVTTADVDPRQFRKGKAELDGFAEDAVHVVDGPIVLRSLSPSGPSGYAIYAVPTDVLCDADLTLVDERYLPPQQFVGTGGNIAIGSDEHVCLRKGLNNRYTLHWTGFVPYD